MRPLTDHCTRNEMAFPAPQERREEPTEKAVQSLKIKGHLHCESARGHIVGAAEGGEEVVKGIRVGHIDRGQVEVRLEAVSVKQVVLSHRHIKEIAGSNSLRVVIVVAEAGRRDLDQA